MGASAKDNPGEPAIRPAPRPILLRWLTRVSFLYLAVVVALWILLRWADLWWPATLVLFSPRLLFALPLAILAPAAFLVRRPRLLLPLGLAGLLVAGPLSGGRIPWRRLFQPSSEGTPFRVLTCNMHYGRFAPAPLEELVLDTIPDVVVLQEWNRHNHSELFTAGGWHTHRTAHQFLASRHPILHVEELGRDSEQERGSVTRYDLDAPGGVLPLVSVHLASPRHGIYQTITQDENGAATIDDNAARRWRQSLFVASAARQAGESVLIVGDFNTPPESAIFRLLWQDYTDAFDEAGWGWGYTFRGSKTAVRIDHVLMGPGWQCRRCWVGPSIGSPHRPVLADLVR